MQDNTDKLDRFITILSSQAESRDLHRQKLIAEKVLAMYAEVCSTPLQITTDAENTNYYITKGILPDGKYYPCAVAHLDQVHYTKAWYKIFQDGDTIFAMSKTASGEYLQVGTGSDDLAGVWMCLELLISQPFMKVAFFSDEEIGCLGSKKAKKEFFDDCSFVMQADRRGNTKDFITYTNGTSVSSTEFQNEVDTLLTKYDYKKGTGSSTDVGQLTKNGIGICTVNLSCGYFNAHTDNETSSISDSFTCLGLMTDMANDLVYKRWEYIPPVEVKPFNSFKNNTYPSNRWDTEDFEWSSNHWNNNKKRQNLKPFDIKVDNFLLNISKITSHYDLDDTLNYLSKLNYTYHNNVSLLSNKFDEQLFFATHLAAFNKPKLIIIPKNVNAINTYRESMVEVDLSSFYETYVIKPKNTGTNEKPKLFNTSVDQDVYTCPMCKDVYSLKKLESIYLGCMNSNCDCTKISVYNLNKLRVSNNMKPLRWKDVQEGFNLHQLTTF